jgi:hypothetical protein
VPPLPHPSPPQGPLWPRSPGQLALLASSSALQPADRPATHRPPANELVVNLPNALVNQARGCQGRQSRPRPPSGRRAPRRTDTANVRRRCPAARHQSPGRGRPPMGSVTIKTFGARTQKPSVITAIKTQSQTNEQVPLIVDEPGTLQVAGSSRASPWRAPAPGTFRDPKAFWATYVAVIADHSRVRRFTRRIRTDLAPNDQQWKPGINGTGFLVRRHGDRGGRPWSAKQPHSLSGQPQLSFSSQAAPVHRGRPP